MWSRQASYTLWHVLCTLLHLIMRHCWLIMSCSNSPYTIRGATLPLISILGRYTKKNRWFSMPRGEKDMEYIPQPPPHTKKLPFFFKSRPFLSFWNKLVIQTVRSDVHFSSTFLCFCDKTLQCGKFVWSVALHEPSH